MKLTPYKIYFQKQVLLACLVTLLVLASQMLAGAHASEHLFHEADTNCIMFSGAEKLSTAGPALLSAIRDYQFLLHQKLPSVKADQADSPTSYLSRAPPVSY